MTTSATPNAAQILAALSSSANPKGGLPLPAWYGMVVLGMASQAYTAQGGSDWSGMQAALYTAITDPQYTPPLPAPSGQQGTVAGAWSLDWGPANGQDGTGDNSNLTYIASYRAADNPNYADGAPYFFVVSIRGTDVAVTGTPLLQQLLQDIRDFRLLSWPDLLNGKLNNILNGNLSLPTPNATNADALKGNVAHGTMLGLVNIANATAPLNDGSTPSNSGTPITVVAALNALLADYPGTPIVVTGHSLGAALTQVMASYLAWQFPSQPVIPFTYAPPTAGDADFVATYSAQCPLGQFWYNSFDVVPYAYITMQDQNQTVSGLSWAGKNLWTAYQWPPGPPGAPTQGPPLPQAMIDTIATLGTQIPATFERPANGVYGLQGNIPPLTGLAAFLKAMGGGLGGLPPASGLAQLVWQHFPPCYRDLMTAQYGAYLAPFAFKSYVPQPAAAE